MGVHKQKDALANADIESTSYTKPCVTVLEPALFPVYPCSVSAMS